MPATEAIAPKRGRSKIVEASPEQVPEICEQLVSMHRTRIAAEKARIKIVNGLGGYLRAEISESDPRYRVTGADDVQVEKLRKEVNNRAKKMIAAVKSGEPCEDNMFDALRPFIEQVLMTAEPFDRRDTEIEKAGIKLAKTLPAARFVAGVRGFAVSGLVVVIGEAGGDLRNYPSRDALWKRCGIARVQHADGSWHTQGKPRGQTSAEDWIRHGFSPRRLGSIMGRIAVPLMMSRPPGTDDIYRRVYDRARAGKTPLVELTAELPAGDAAKWTAKRVADHARRVMVKALIEDLWRVWNGRDVRQWQL